MRSLPYAHILIPLLLGTLTACGAAEATRAPAAHSGETQARPQPASLAQPDEAAAQVEALLGSWRLTHGGDDWMTLTFWLTDQRLHARADDWNPNHSWTEFTVVRVKLSLRERVVRIDADYDDFDTGVTVTLRLEEGRLAGEAAGPTYDTPIAVAGVRAGTPAP